MIQKTDKARLLDRTRSPAVGDVCLCTGEERVVIVKAGAAHVVKGPGLHPITEPDLEVNVVRTSPVDGLRGGGPVGPVKDERTGVEVEMRAIFEAKIQVTDPSTFVTNIGGFEQDGDLRQHVAGRVLDAVKAAVASGGPILAWAASPTALEPRILEVGTEDLSSVGIRLLALASFTLTVPEDDLAKLQSLRDTMAAPVAPPSAARLPPSSSQQLAAVVPSSAPSLPSPPSSQRAPVAGPGYVPPPMRPAPVPQPLVVGSRVRVPWSDGRWYAGTVRQFHNGYVEVAWDGSTASAWLLPHQLRPG